MDQQATQDRSLSDLGRQLSLQTTELVRHEVELAKAELQVKGKRAAEHAGALGVYARVADTPLREWIRSQAPAGVD